MEADSASCPSDSVLAAIAGILDVAAHLEFDLTPTAMCGSRCWIGSCCSSLSGAKLKDFNFFFFKPQPRFLHWGVMLWDFACGAN